MKSGACFPQGELKKEIIISLTFGVDPGTDPGRFL